MSGRDSKVASRATAMAWHHEPPVIVVTSHGIKIEWDDLGVFLRKPDWETLAAAAPPSR